MSKSNQLPKPSAPQPRFQIAARLGGFKDTIQVPDPLGTSAVFTIYRSGCNAHREWSRGQMDCNPVIAEIVQGLDAIPPALTDDEKEVVDTARETVDTDNTARLLVPVIDRLVTTTVERNLEREATRKAVAGGRLKPSQVFLQGVDAQLAEGLFTLKTWDDMPAEDGSIIPFSAAAAKELLTSDTPLEDAGIDEMVLAVPAWTSTVKETETTTTTIILPGLTLGRAYILYFLAMSADRTLFRNQTMEAAAKNLGTPSDGSTSSGGGNEGAAN